jgi:hypothetical protein
MLNNSFYLKHHKNLKPFNPILHTWIGDSCFTCDGSRTIQVSPLLFKIGMVI